MNVEVRHNNTNITQYVIESQRTHKLCEGSGEATIKFFLDNPRTFTIGDTFKLYEAGILKGIFYLSRIDDDADSGESSLICFDGAKWIREFLLVDLFTVTGGQSARYWIEIILDQTGISYNFTTAESGATLPDTEFGIEFAYDAVLRLCQQSGWYFYFDSNGVCQIGSLSDAIQDTVGYYREDGEILEILRRDDSTPLRNKVIIWGAHLSKDFKNFTIFPIVAYSILYSIG